MKIFHTTNSKKKPIARHSEQAMGYFSELFGEKVPGDIDSVAINLAPVP